jgi:hypothetical protein
MIHVPFTRLPAPLLALAIFVCACAGGAVTQRNLLESEHFWPYRVALIEPWPVASSTEPIPRGMTGVLIRVERSGLPRIDFGARGKYEIPVDHTDLLERANRIRTGELEKAEPNFVHAIKTRMLAAAADDALRPLPAEASEGRSGFFCVFADPAAEGFAEIAAALAPLRERSGVMTILFAQGQHPDAALLERLRSLEWPVPFVYDFLAEPYTRTLLADGTPLPALLLQTNEGRVIFASRWSADVVPDLVAAWDVAFGPR